MPAKLTHEARVTTFHWSGTKSYAWYTHMNFTWIHRIKCMCAKSQCSMCATKHEKTRCLAVGFTAKAKRGFVRDLYWLIMRSRTHVIVCLNGRNDLNPPNYYICCHDFPSGTANNVRTRSGGTGFIDRAVALIGGVDGQHELPQKKISFESTRKDGSMVSWSEIVTGATITCVPQVTISTMASGVLGPNPSSVGVSRNNFSEGLTGGGMVEFIW